MTRTRREGLSARSVLTVLAFALVVSASVAGPVVGQATPAPTPTATENGSNGSMSTNGSGTPYPVQTLTPTATENGSVAGNATGNGSGNDSGGGSGNDPAGDAGPAPDPSSTDSGSGGGGGGFGIPSAGDLAGEAANGTISTFNSILAKTIGPVFRLPWAIITVRFAPLEATGEYGDGLWGRPPGLFGQIYDAAMDLFVEFALLFIALVLVIDWFGNLSPSPRTQGAIERLWRQAGDLAHLLFSWPIAWAHFLLSSIVCLVFMPSNAQVIGELSDYWAQLAAIGPLAGLVFLTGPLLVIVVLYLFTKHAGAFIYMLAGIVAYPFLVVMGIPDHWLLGRLGEYAENAREGFVVAAWYPVPTAFVLGFGYWIDEAFLNAITLGGPIGEVGAGSVYYPILWLAALYAPLKVFSNGNPARYAKTAALSAGIGGAAGAASGAGAGSAAGSASGLAAGSGAGAASGLPAGAGAGAATGSATGTAGSTATRMAAGSPGASALADGGTTLASNGGGSAGPLGDYAESASAGGAGSAGIGGAGTAGRGAASTSDLSQSAPEGTTRVADRGSLDTGQRYEPLVQHDSGKLARVSTPKDANWLADQGGIENLNRGTDEPLYFRGETDGELYDLSGTAGSSESVYGGTGADIGGSDSVRDYGSGSGSNTGGN